MTGPSSDLLVQYLSSTSCAKDKRVIELGAGCGYVGLAAAILGAKSVTMTDMMVTQNRMEYDSEGLLVSSGLSSGSRVLLNNCDYNVSLNKELVSECQVQTQSLHWGKEYQHEIDKIYDSMSSCDLLLGSDLTYSINMSHSLFWTISYIMRRQRELERLDLSRDKLINRSCRCLLAHEHRLDESTKIVLAAAAEMGLRHIEIMTASAPESSGTLLGGKFVLWEMVLDNGNS